MAVYQPKEEPAQQAVQPPERKIGYVTERLEQGDSKQPAKPESTPYRITDWASF